MSNNKTNDDDLPTPYEHFLWLLFELEQAVERKGIDWSAANPHLIQGRLLKLTEKVARASNPRGGGVTH